MKIALRPVVVAVVVASMMVFAFGARALAADGRRAEDTQADVTHPDAQLPSAPVEIDGTVLFQVRGAAAFPAEKRAAAIASRIETLAADASVPADAVRPVEVENGKLLSGLPLLQRRPNWTITGYFGC